MTYFDRPSVSNSNLTELRRAYYCIEEIDLASAYKFGSLVDAMLTEEHRVRYHDCTLLDDDELIQYTEQDFDLAKTLVKKCRLDPVIKFFIEQGSGQHIFDRLLQFEFDGETYEIQARCKFDTIKESIRTGADYKTTACTSYKSFVESIEHFNYDQQAAWYMDIAQIDRHWIIGISKTTGQIFKYAIQRGDETYLRGKDKYSFWAYRWLVLVEGFLN